MKDILIIILLSVVILLPSRSDSIINEFVNAPEFKKPFYITHKDIIYVCCSLIVPFSGECNLNRSITYVHEMLSALGNSNEDCCMVKVTLEMSSELYDYLGMMHPAWSIAESSEDTIRVSKEGIVILEKKYFVSNRPDIILNAQFIITTEGVGIGGLRLDKIISNPSEMYGEC